MQNIRADKNILGVQGSIPINTPSVGGVYVTSPDIVNLYGWAGTSGYGTVDFHIPNIMVLDGTGYLRKEIPNLVPDNIKSGVVIGTPGNACITGTASGVIGNIITGDYIACLDPTNSLSADYGWCSSKTLVINKAGTYKLKFDIMCMNSNIKYQIYKNGNMTEYPLYITGSSSYQTINHGDIVLNVNDTIHVQFTANSGAGCGSGIKNTRLCCNIAPIVSIQL